MTSCRHTLPILIEYAWSMARVWLEYAYSEITAHSQRDYSSLSTRLRLTISLLLMLTLGSGNVWGQDYSGVYYIGTVTHSTESTTNNFYLCPTEGYYYYQSTSPYYTNDVDNGMPFLTTYKCRSTVGYDEKKALWVIEKHPSLDCYYIKHAIDGKYLTYNAGFLTNKGRVRFHLEESPSNNDYALFFINYYSATGSYEIISKYASDNNIDPDGNKPRKYLNINKGNQSSLAGTDADKTQAILTGGIIGLWTAGNSESTGSGRFYLESAVSIDPPTITNNFDGTITIEAATGATIYYTTDGSTPTMSSPVYSTAITLTEDFTVIKAIAKAESDYYPTVATTYNLPSCERPSISVSGGNVTITCTTEGATIHYTTDGSHATSSSTVYTGPFAKGSANEIRAIATKVGYVNSNEAALLPPTEVSSSSEITNMIGNYILSAGFSSTESIGTSEAPFKGTIDGNMVTISDLNHPLIAYANDATIKNIILDNVNISGGTNVGAICAEATGDTRIYNCGVLATGSTANTDEDGYTYLTSCSSTVSGSNYVGGIVGLLDGSSRVINCFSYANVNGGSEAGGIVGHNNVATTATNLKTMVMNCMYYGEVSGSSIAPIYNGEIITNDGDDNGVNNFNYFRLESSYIENTGLTKVYNCALGAETRYLQRFEFFRHLLNSNRELAAWWTTGSPDKKDEMMKWVLEPSQIGSSTPYPILKNPGYSPSVVNIDAENAPLATERNKGGKLGTLSVTIQSGNGEYFNAPSGATITKNSLTLNITDKDFDHFNFNYYKVQLPYYNDVGTGNYTENRVVTGWKIISITGGTPGTFSTSTADAPSYNFADRNCTNKDLYSTSHRVFNQGAYWDVPEGVTGITIQPYWGKAVYLSDAYWDVTYKNSGTDAMDTPVNVNNVGGGQHYGNGETFNSQPVYTAIGDAIASTALYAGTNEATYSVRRVYDYAVVLVGNYHHYGTIAAGGKPYTLTSVDMDGDNEPDYSLMLRFNGRTVFHPVKYDFLNILGLGMAQKTTGGTGSYNLGIIQPKYWFETTNTSLFHVTQFEYDRSDRGEYPYIVQGGVMEQWVSGQNNGAANKTTYFHVGGNVWFKEFHRGTHQDKNLQSKHPPVSVTGGDYDEFYLTGLYTANVANYEDNAECYINGGRFGTVAGAAMEGIGKADGADNTGNITWQVQNADIKEFYAGGINAAKPVTGNLSTTITGGKIDLFCGGPKFGDMSTGKTVTTDATDCIFGTFFGAGYGGNSYSRQAPRNHNNIINFPHKDKDAGNHNSWNDWLDDYYTQSYSATYGGVSTQFSYQFLPMSGNVDNCARIFVEYVKFSLATCRNVTSTLTGCKITGNFYGGGSLGKVDGPVTSTLTNCQVQGNVFGAGFSASMPPVEVDNIGFETEPYYYTDLGTYRTGVKSGTVTYTWQKKNGDKWVDNGEHILYTDEDLTTLGAVTGKATLTIDGTTTVAESVYGGGEESSVGGDTEVNVTGGTIGTGTTGGGNLFGGGKGLETDYSAALVKGNSTIMMSDGVVKGNIYGGGELSSVGTFTYNSTDPSKIDSWTDDTGKTTITISGGTIGNESDFVYDSGTTMTRANSGNVFAGSKGILKDSNDDYLSNWYQFAKVRETELTVSGGTIMSNIYGGGELGSVGYINTSDALVGGTTVTVSSGTIGTEIKEESAMKYTVGSVFGGGYGSDLESTTGTTDAHAPKLFAGRIYGNTSVTMSDGAVKASVYGGGEMASVGGNATVTVSGGTIGIPKDGDKQFGGATMGNVYGGGSGDKNIVRAGQIFGNTTVSISQAENKTTRIYHNIYGGGAFGSVGTYTYTTTTTDPDYPGIEKVTGISSCTSGGTATITITGGTIGADGKENGMIFGSSRGDVGAPGSRDDLMAWVNTTNVTIGAANTTGPTIMGSVYGSGENGHTLNNTDVTIHSGKIGIDSGDDVIVGTTTYEAYNYPYRGNVYGGGCGTDKYYTSEIPEGHTATDGEGDSYNPLAGIVQGTATVTIDGGYIVHNVYGAGAMGSVGGGTTTDAGKTTVAISGGRIGYDGSRNGNVFGAARGEYGTSTDLSKNLANVRETVVTINKHPSDATKDPVIWGSVFGGGESGTVKESVAVNMTGGMIHKDVYGGGALADTQTSNWNTTGGIWVDADKKSALNTTTVHLTGGRVGEEVFGGGLGEAGKPAYVWGDVLVDLNGTTIEDNGTSPISTSSKGCIVNQVFGCNNVNGSPRGDVLVHVHATQNGDASKTNIAAKFAKDNEDLEQGESSDADYIAKLKRILADKIVIADKVSIEVAEYQAVLDNDDATVTALKTALTNIIAAISAKTSDDDMMKIINGTKYDVNAVYGGGNQAAYEPVGPNPNATDDDGKNTTNSTKVIIDGCGLTSIQTVYGGGNAASTPATETTVNGTYEIYELFGGGNGKDKLPSGADNPGANVGFYDYSAVESTYDTKEERQQSDFVNNYVYGTGKATVNIFGGTIWRVFGGSNTKGNVRQTALTMLDEGTACPFCVEEAYGGGKSAEMDAEAQLLMACIPGLEAVYGGAEAADVHGNVTLNITNGTFDRVFGGNNKSGTIGGSITINVEEIGCRPVKIGELYGGGNLAGYSVYGYDSDSKPKESGTTKLYNDPQINVMSFTSIGDIYGGGYGETAVMVGNPTVNVNEAYGKYYDKDESIVGENAKTPNNYPIPSHAKGKMGAISNVFGGGNAAKVIGNTNVNIATLDEVYVVKQVTVGETVSGLYTRSGAGTTASPFVYTATASTDVAVDGTTYYEKLDVLGVDIRGNVYGGGNNAEVTGNGNVVIGKRVE